MSMPTIDCTDDGFDDFEFALIVADFDQSEPDTLGRVPAQRRRPARGTADREAIDQSRGIFRHRTGERRD